MNNPATQFTVQLPDWLTTRLQSVPDVFATLEDRMSLALELARANVKENTGGPFGAVIYEEESGCIVAAGVNLVTHSGLSMTHAEVVAISLAQTGCKSFDLRSDPLPKMQLVTTAEPCWMCLGAIHWAGLSSIVCGARDEDVRRIGFDEGHKTGGWVDYYESNGITVTRDIMRQEAIEILELYRKMGRKVYNPADGGSG